MNAKQSAKVAGWGLAIAVVVSVVAGPADAQFGQRKKGDSRVAAALDQLGLKYVVDGDGDYCLPFDKAGVAGAQLVFVNSKTAKLGTLEIREVWALAKVSREPFSQQALATLLADNHRMPLGAWRIVDSPLGQIAIFAAQVSADADAVTLFTAAVTVAKAAELQPLRDGEKESGHRPVAPTSSKVASRGN